MSLKDDVSKVLRFRFSDEAWMAVYDQLNIEGRLDAKTLGRLVFILCQHLDALEKGQQHGSTESTKH